MKKASKFPRSISHGIQSQVNTALLNIIPFRQRAGYCGPASLKMICNYYNVEKEEMELAKMLGRKASRVMKNRGVSAEKLVEIAQKIGFKAFIKDYSTLEDIKYYITEKKIPIIVDWFEEDDGHYSVVCGIDEENVYLVDPSLGQIHALRIPTFKRVWFDFEEAYLKSKKDLILRRMIVIEKP